MFLTSCTPNIFFFASFDFRTWNQRFPKFSHLNKHSFSDVSVELVSFPAFTNKILLSPVYFRLTIVSRDFPKMRETISKAILLMLKNLKHDVLTE